MENQQNLTVEQKCTMLMRTLRKAIRDINEIQKDLEWTKERLMEAQERNRKLDILLTAAMEGREIR